MLSKTALFWLALSTLPLMAIAKFTVGSWGIYLAAAFGIFFITLWRTHPVRQKGDGA
jgi:hypothetical protein